MTSWSDSHDVGSFKLPDKHLELRPAAQRGCKVHAEGH